MAEIILANQAANFSKRVKKEGKTTVLVGGCFDVLHPGHVIFLERAKKAGDVLVVLLESDKKVKSLKGLNRPVHSQKDRAKILAALRVVDCVVRLPFMDSEASYDELMQKIKPDIIAATAGYTNTYHHERTAKLVGAKLKYVTKLIGNHSTSRILKDKR